MKHRNKTKSQRKNNANTNIIENSNDINKSDLAIIFNENGVEEIYFKSKAFSNILLINSIDKTFEITKTNSEKQSFVDFNFILNKHLK